jgi:8-oxo-dGTP diphosphatase
MTDWRNVPVFGTRAAFPVVIRPSAYSVIVDDHGRLALVRTPSGVYLPGGGQVGAETPVDTVVRETVEECGLTVRVGRWHRTAVEYVSSALERTHFEKRSTFCDATVIASTDSATEPDHSLIWVLPNEAADVLTPESHRWAVTEWLRSRERRAARIQLKE